MSRLSIPVDLVSSIGKWPIDFGEAPLAEEVVRQLIALRERIPDFALMEAAETRSMRRTAAVSPEFVHASINGIAASPALENALGRDAESLRTETELLGRWSQVVAEIDTLRQGVLGSIKIRRHRLGATTLRAYQVSRQLARYNENAILLPHIEAMKRAANFPKRRAAQPQPGTQPEPQPAPPAVKQ